MAAAQQVAPRPLITQPIDESQLVTLRGNTHPLAQPQFDLGQAPPNLPLQRMLLVLQRSPQQEHVLRTLLDDQQDKASPNYHKWLTPNQFGTTFGPADQDVQVVTSWLQSHGLQVNRISRGKSIIEFSGVESQIEGAFNTQIHQYLVNGENHWANATDPQIPAALAPVVAGVRSLNDFKAKGFSHIAGVITRDKSTGQMTSAQPLFTLGGNCGVQSHCYGVGPYDFANIYDVANSWNATPPIDGTGQTIAIVGETDINPQDVADFRNFFGLPAYGQPGGPTFTVTHDGPAPGILNDGEETESDLDVEWSGAVAKGASVDFVVSQTTETTLGIDLSALYIVDNNLAPVMSESYGICELHLGTAGNQFYSLLWEQAAAQGITVMISSGDGGSAGCDNFDVLAPAQLGLQVSGFASTPFNVAVGGTDFNDLKTASTYWSATNAATTQASALSYIPETTWDDNCTNPVFGTLGFSTNAETNCNNPQLVNNGFVNIISGSGGRSGCISSDGINPGTCAGGYAKPSWQVAPGVPSDGVRDVPDISLYAASGSPSGSFYVVCEADAVPFASCDPTNPSAYFLGIGGTSASAPAFAGIMALVNQKTQSPQGNANFVLYKLAQQHPSVFHDVTTGTIEVPCKTGTLNCTTSHAGDQYGILSGYNTGTNYDLATGIGSVDVGQLLQNWASATFRPSITNLTLSPTTGLTHGQSVAVTGGVAPSTGSGTPTGDVSLLTSTGVSVDGFTLSGGAISGNTGLLPGGSYTVTAHYAGDTTFGGSDSTPVAVTVGKENSSTQLQLVTFDWQGNLISSNATSAAYGSFYLLRADVLNSHGAACLPNPLGQVGCPSGNVVLTDNAIALDGGAFPLNTLGYTEDQAIQLSGGSHSIKGQYAGDSSFNASSATATYSVTPAATKMIPLLLNCCLVAGGQLQIQATLSSQSTGSAPTGAVTFFSNGTMIPGNVSYQGNPGSGSSPTAGLAATLFSSSTPFPTAGTYTLTATYSGDGNYSSSTSQGSTVIVKYPAPGIYMGSPGFTVAAGASATVTAIVDTFFKHAPAPTGAVQFVDWPTMNPIPGNVTYSTIADANGNVALQASLTFVPAASMSVAAAYSGDSNYPAASGGSGLEDITVIGTDFTLVPSQTSVTVSQGAAAVVLIYVEVQSGYSGTLNFAPTSCSGVPRESSCSFLPASVTGLGYAGLTLNTTAPHALAAEGSPPSMRNLAIALGTPFVAILFLPVRRRKLGWLWVSIVCVLLPMGVGCGGGGGGGGGGSSSDPGTPRGSYPITVTATSGSGATAITHTTTFTLVVQ